MKPENITTGHHKIGPFDISIQRPVFRTESEDSFTHFEVFVIRKCADGILIYEDLLDLQIYYHLGWCKLDSAFVRRITEEDVKEYNAWVISKYTSQPTSLLSRANIVKLFSACEALTKMYKKNK